MSARKDYRRSQLGLTPKQTIVLKATVRGLCIKRISRETGMAGGTVKIHTCAILKTLGVPDRQAVIAEVARRAGVDLAAWVEAQA